MVGRCFGKGIATDGRRWRRMILRRHTGAKNFLSVIRVPVYGSPPLCPFVDFLGK
jgi:hypothetical protein